MNSLDSDFNRYLREHGDPGNTIIDVFLIARVNGLIKLTSTSSISLRMQQNWHTSVVYLGVHTRQDFQTVTASQLEIWLDRPSVSICSCSPTSEDYPRARLRPKTPSRSSSGPVLGIYPSLARALNHAQPLWIRFLFSREVSTNDSGAPPFPRRGSDCT